MIIETLSSQPGREDFDCGDPEMNQWLQRYARQSDRRHETLTRVALDPHDGRIIGYYATKAYQLEGASLLEALGDDASRYPVPCVLLARLARCLSVRGEGIGDILLAHALRACVRVAENTGVKFVIVHAIDDNAVRFYERNGFTRFVDHPQHLLMPMKHIRQLFTLPDSS
ncbi:GNAT family N-acetyltransferase [Schumannella luteola]